MKVYALACASAIVALLSIFLFLFLHKRDGKGREIRNSQLSSLHNFPKVAGSSTHRVSRDVKRTNGSPVKDGGMVILAGTGATLAVTTTVGGIGSSGCGGGTDGDIGGGGGCGGCGGGCGGCGGGSGG